MCVLSVYPCCMPRKSARSRVYIYWQKLQRCFKCYNSCEINMISKRNVATLENSNFVNCHTVIGIRCGCTWKGDYSSLSGPRGTCPALSRRMALRCIAFCIALHCIALHRLTLHCITLPYIASHCIAFHCIACHCITLLCIALHCMTFHCITLHLCGATMRLCGANTICIIIGPNYLVQPYFPGLMQQSGSSIWTRHLDT